MDQDTLTVTVSKAAAMLSVGRSTAYALVARGEWPSVRVGRTVRVPVQALREWVAKGTRACHKRHNEEATSL